MNQRVWISKGIFTALILLPIHICRAENSEFSLTRHFSQGRWRTEFVSTSGTWGSQWPQHEKDYFVIGSIEYEWPIHRHCTFSLRSYPLFFYNRHKTEKLDSADIYGAAFGAALRLYQKKGKRGLFAELGSSALWHSNYLPGNGSKLNFISDIGLGYQFNENFSICAKYFHLSNAGLDEPNSGFDALAITAGYRF